MKRISAVILVCMFFVVGCDDGDSPADASGAANTTNDLLKKQWVLVSAGWHTCGIKGDGTLWCWGNNEYGQLGIGTSGWNDCDIEDLKCKDTDKPTRVGSDSDWDKISLGFEHTCAIKKNGTLWCWGWNHYGQLGIDSSLYSCNDKDICRDKKEPTQVGEAADWMSISSGYDYTCAIKTNGTLWCWGNNERGQLGLGYNSHWLKSTPVQVGTASDWISINAGGTRVCAIKADRTLWCWGGGLHGYEYWDPALQYKGELGWEMLGNYEDFSGIRTDGTMWKSEYDYVTEIEKLVQIGTDSDWGLIDVNRCNNHSFGCAIKKNGTLWCWGNNYWGQLGIGTSNEQSCPFINGVGEFFCEDKTDPTQVGSETGWTQISTGSGSGYSCAIKTDGTLWCWGSNWKGELGIGMSESNCSEGETCTYKTVPTQVVEGK